MVHNSKQAGKERWTVKHQNGKIATYLVSWNGDSFQVVPEKRIKTGSTIPTVR